MDRTSYFWLPRQLTSFRTLHLPNELKNKIKKTGERALTSVANDRASDCKNLLTLIPEELHTLAILKVEGQCLPCHVMNKRW